ncbi:MAG: DNA replication and repair protein RecF [Deltaproteobacteria bacterium]|nr:MAG: DNA replication and repair protein RecF [Deltaproteobacteria bacterium]
MALDADAPDASTEPLPLTLDHLVVTQLRNIARGEVELGPRLNVIAGNNGQGKTSILEAVYLLATSRSFRTARLSEVVKLGSELGNVRGRFVEHWPNGPLPRQQSVGIRGTEGGAQRRICRIDDSPPTSLSHYATRSPVVVFDPQQMTLSTGSASGRRTLLDRLTLFTDPAVASHRSWYRRALRERQLLLRQHLGSLERRSELDAFETLLAEHGAAITKARRAASEILTAEMTRAFERIGAPKLVLEGSYRPGGSEDIDEASEALQRGRPADAQRKRTGFGPHRDDLHLLIDGQPARIVGSQGQHRAITLALKIAELRCIADARGVLPLLLLDDVSSELDADRLAALVDHLAMTRSQILLTTTRRDLIVTSQISGSDRQDFTITAGVVTAG